MKKNILSIMLIVLFICVGCSQKIDNENIIQPSSDQMSAENINESGSDKANNQSAEQNTSEIIDTLASKEYYVEKEHIEDSKETIVLFAQNFINLFTGSIGENKNVSFENYITNENLLKFVKKMVKLEAIKDLDEGNCVIYSLENKFNDIDFKSLNENLCFLKINFSNQGSGMVSQMLVKKENDKISIVDVYFGSKGGVDTLTTGHHTERKLDNSDLWNDETWVQNVFEKLEKYEEELTAQKITN